VHEVMELIDLKGDYVLRFCVYNSIFLFFC
jgi:hypothetical protein